MRCELATGAGTTTLSWFTGDWPSPTELRLILQNSTTEIASDGVILARVGCLADAIPLQAAG